MSAMVSIILTCLVILLLGVETTLSEKPVYNPCCSFPCQNDGVCTTRGFTDYECDCSNTGYYGRNCDRARIGTAIKNMFKMTTETKHHLLVNLKWLWKLINSLEFIHTRLMGFVYLDRSANLPRPTMYTSEHHYATILSSMNGSYYARLLPPVPTNCPTPMGVAGKKQLPPVKEIAELICKRREFKPDPIHASVHLPSFAQHFTHQFFKTDYQKGPSYQIGAHGVDASNIYGGHKADEDNLRSHTGGRLKTQTLNGEEYPPYLEECAVDMTYPTNTHAKQQFALGHKFFGLLPTLFLYSTIWMREHNRVAGILQELHPDWEDEQLFQTSKLIIIGEIIQIVIADYVQTISNYNIKLDFIPEALFGANFQYQNRITVEFAHLYHWHPMFPDEIRVENDTYAIDDVLFHSEIVVKHGVAKFAEALTSQVSGAFTHRNHGKSTLHVVSMMLEYSRQLRMQPYNHYRKKMGLSAFTSFKDLTGEDEISQILEDMYSDINAVEYFIGLLTEKRAEHAKFSLTMLQVGASFSITGLLSNPICSPHMWKPSTFGGQIGMDIIKAATVQKLFCDNIKGKCPKVSFTTDYTIEQNKREKTEL